MIVRKSWFYSANDRWCPAGISKLLCETQLRRKEDEEYQIRCCKAITVLGMLDDRRYAETLAAEGCLRQTCNCLELYKDNLEVNRVALDAIIALCEGLSEGKKKPL